MRNTQKDFHPGVFTETLWDFCKKVLLPILLILVSVYFAFFESKIYAKEPVKKSLKTETFYIVQDYVGDVRLHPSHPYRLSCEGKKCVLFRREVEVDNFFANKKCKKVSASKVDPVFEYTCSDSRITRRVMEISGQRYFLEILSTDSEKYKISV